mmetsp:Transcript_95497/g.165898  ORF Transcript_95497/g.165898 Transcript_95497/m.165898 type:complete len:821 (-) Transcript_95497:23-2485(-)
MTSVPWCRCVQSLSLGRSLCCTLALAWVVGHVEGVPGKSRRFALTRSEQSGLEVENYITEESPAESGVEAGAHPTHPLRISSCSAADYALSSGYMLSEEQLRRGEINSAGAFRFQSFYEKLKNGSNVSIAVLGGPVELGTHCDDCTVLWHEYIRKWLTTTFPRLTSTTEVHVIDLQNTTKLRSAFDFGSQTPAGTLQNYDLVIVAGIGSFYPLQAPASGILAKGIDVNRHYAEQLLRDVLRAPHSPAVLIVAWLNDYWWDTEDAADMLTHNGLAYRFGTLQDEAYEFLAMYYEISMMSARNALLHSTFVTTASSNLAPGWNHTNILRDRLYPTAAGHNLLGQLAVNFLCKQLTIAQGLPSGRSRRQRTLSPAVFENPAHLAALRRSMDFSGFPGNPDDSPAVVELTAGTESFALELRSSLAALALLEFVCFACQAPRSSAFGFLYSDAAPMHRRQLHTSSFAALRFLIAAQLVLFYEAIHQTNEYFKHFAAFGEYWMQFFFALVGFASYIVQENAAEVPDTPGFFRKCLADWYPVYIVGAVLSFSAEERPWPSAIQYASGDLLPGFLMADCWAYPYGSNSPNAPAWFLSTLLFLWLCFPHWYSTIRALRAPWMAVLFAYLSTFAVPLAYSSRYFGILGNTAELFPYPSRFLECHPFANWQSCIFGMGLARVTSEARLEALPAVARERAAFSALAVLLLLPGLMPWSPSPILKMLLQQGPVLLPLFGVVLVFVAAGEDKLLTPRLLESSRAQWLGRMSRPLLVLHQPFRIWISAWVIDPSWQTVLIIQFWATWAYSILEQGIVSMSHCGTRDEFHQTTSKT